MAALLSCSLLLPHSSSAQVANVLSNPGFEERDTAWRVGEGGSLVTTEAARTGKYGVRIINDRTKAKGSNASSARFPVTEGQQIALNFWARSDAKGAGVYLMYFGENGRMVQDPGVRGGLPVVGIAYDDVEWHEYSLAAAAPAVAHTVMIWCHTYSTAEVVVDLDDFVLTGFSADVEPVLPKPYVAPKALPPLDLNNIPQREEPPVIIIKLDDLKMHHGRPHPRWIRVADYLAGRGIKGTSGMLGSSLVEATPEYVQWIKSHRDSGGWEFWYHGWDHLTHTDDDGVTYNEHNHRSFDEQKRRLHDTQELCLEKLGFALTCFGPPGGVGNGIQDENTHRMMTEDPHMTAWLYPSLMDALGKGTMAQGKVTILDRVWDVNLEGSVGAADFDRFVRGYIKNLDRPYFVLQGHPMMWDDYRFEQFTKIIDFLVEQKAVFMLPSEYAASLKGR